MRKRVRHLLSILIISGFVIMAFGSEDDKNKPVNEGSTVNKTEEKPEIEILKQTAEYEAALDSYTIHCRVKNNTDELINYLDLKATFYDKNGKIVGTGMGNAANFAAQAEKTIDVMGLDIQNVATYEVEVNNILN